MAETTSHAERDSHTKWNFVVISAESASFQAGMMWADPATVLPQFVAALGGSLALVGLVTTLQRLGYALPQIPMAALVGHRPERRPYLRWGVLIFRAPFLAFLLYLWIRGVANPAMVLTLLLLTLFLVSFGNGVVAVPWQDIIAKSIPPGLRGRFFGVMQFSMAAIVMGIGFAVRSMLGPTGPGFPRAYIVLLSLTGLFYCFSTLGCWLMREPIRPVLEQPERVREVLAGIAPLLRREAGLRRLAVIALLGPGLVMCTSFYTSYATLRLHVAPELAGIYLQAGTIGAALSSLLWGRLTDRLGPRTPLLGGAAGITVAPLLALIIPPLTHALGASATVLPYLFALVFLVAGASGNGFWIGTNTYLYAVTSHVERPRVIAILSTLALPGAFLPFAFGLVLGVCPFAVVFVIMATLGVGVLMTAARMPRPNAG